MDRKAISNERMFKLQTMITQLHARVKKAEAFMKEAQISIESNTHNAQKELDARITKSLKEQEASLKIEADITRKATDRLNRKF